MKNFEHSKEELEQLITKGSLLFLAMYCECHPEQHKKILDDKSNDAIKKLPKFKEDYQSWYSESLIIIKLLLPDRRDDFIKLYEKPKARRSITSENYVIDDYLQGLNVTRGSDREIIVTPNSAIPKFEQQLNILKSAKRRFESTLFDIKTLVQADLFDSEIDAAMELNKKGFCRGAGAIAGVVLEHHLLQICQNHMIKIPKKDPTINDYNDLLKNANIIETHNWRFIQHLADLRNLCDHKKSKDPSRLEIEELIKGVQKVTKTIY